MLALITMKLAVTGPSAAMKAFTAAVESARAGDRLRFDEAPWDGAAPVPTGARHTESAEARLRSTLQAALAVAHILDGPAFDRGGERVTYELSVAEVPLFTLEATSRHHRDLTFRIEYELGGHQVEATFIRGRYTLGARSSDAAVTEAS